ncbi:MAG: hypothetical protein QXO78_01665 [Desulfurococcaceae archaeon]
MWLSDISDSKRMINDWEKSYCNMIRAAGISRKYLILISLIIPSFILPLISVDEIILAISLITGLISVVSVFVFVVNFAIVIEDHIENTKNYFEKLINLVSIVMGREAAAKIEILFSNQLFQKRIYVKYTPVILLIGFISLLFASDPTKHFLMIISLLIFNALPSLFINHLLIIYNNHIVWEVSLIRNFKNIVGQELNELMEYGVFKTRFYPSIILSIITFTLYPVVKIILKFNSHYDEHVSRHRKNHSVIKSYFTKTLRL